MITSSVGRSGANKPSDVIEVQRLLNPFTTVLKIPALDIDGKCGTRTKRAIAAFQSTVVGFGAADGRVDPGGRTWQALVIGPGPAVDTKPAPAEPLATLLTPGPRTALTPDDYAAAAAKLGCDVPAITAVAQVECARDAFDDRQRPTILYERHIFRRLTGGRYDDEPAISNRKAGGYGKFAEQYPKLEQAYQLDADAALKACSWGMFQILGTNHTAAGFGTVVEYIRAMCQTERDHLDAFVSFIKAHPLMHGALVQHVWGTFAKLYNGPQYKKNAYDKKLNVAYDTKLKDAHAKAGSH